VTWFTLFPRLVLIFFKMGLLPAGPFFMAGLPVAREQIVNCSFSHEPPAVLHMLRDRRFFCE
jgi:hypothetical protein